MYIILLSLLNYDCTVHSITIMLQGANLLRNSSILNERVWLIQGGVILHKIYRKITIYTKALMANTHTLLLKEQKVMAVNNTN